ncbi:MAG TPA: polysaccharide biosynthesis tyrosine autokinase [Verrucomicrobiota bacterium]|nr:polysaccharide biosynthesis tyrosine autokinase [Verrucomicrobiota bacterium]HNT13732.1 polysaccharide biosynthesis tyrosine autokinase [Verrucomicrobiota bacterium]
MDPLKQQTQPEARLHFLDYWRIIRIRKTVIIAVFLLVVITATLVTFILPELFASTASMRVERDKSDIDELSGMSSRLISAYDPYFIQTEFETIQSESILTNVINNLDLTRVWGNKYFEGQPLKMNEALEMLRARMDVRPRRNTSIIDIKVFSDNAKDAADLANAIAEAYKRWRLSKNQEAVMGGIEELGRQLKLQDERIAEIKARLDKLRNDAQISDIDPTSLAPVMQTETEEYKRNLISRFEAENDYKEKKVQYDKLSALSPKELRDVLPRVEPDPVLTDLLQQLNMADQQATTLAVELGPEHPDMKRVQDLQLELENKINDQVRGIMKAMETKLTVAKARLDSFNDAVESARKLDQEQLTKSRPYFDLKRILMNEEDLRTLLARKINVEEIDLSLPKKFQVDIIEYATPGKKPVRPNKTLNIILGVVIGLVVGVGLAFFIEYLDTSVKTIDDVERLLQSPVLGVIPQNVGYLIEEGAESPHAEAYRVLRTNLLFARKDEKLNSIAVVSAGAGEGKSTTVLNLATVFAQSGQRVIIVDSDLRRPTLHKILRVTNNLGLTNYLLKQNSLTDVIQTTSLDKLDFLASGKLPSSSLGILSSNQMKDLINELKQRYDFVFFDSPPIMGVSDASILASEVDITIQVIQYRRYPQPMNIRAKQLIEKVGGNLVGIVLNNINMSQDESYYYYSGYYHDYYAKSEEAEPVAEAAAPGDKDSGEIKQKY